MKGRVLGLDSGGTKTIAVISDPTGSVVSMAFSDGLDPTAGDAWETALAALIAPLGAVGAAALGLPFHGEIERISARQIAVARALIGPQAQVFNDVAMAFEGALAGQDGVLILAGTGSMAWARGILGTCRTGGWGDAFGDEGSAYWIGREALGLVSKHLDGRRPAAEFASGILAALGIAGDDLIGWTYGLAQRRAGIATIAGHVSALAASGDIQAQALMNHAAVHLSALGQAAAKASGSTQPLRWSFAGGAFNDASLQKSVTARMKADPIAPQLPPVGGAVLSAAKAAGWRVDAGFIEQLNRSLSEQMPRNFSHAIEVLR